MSLCLLGTLSCSVKELESPYVSYRMRLMTKVEGVDGSETKADLYNSETEIRTMTLKLFGWEDGTSFVNGSDVTYNTSESKWVVSGGPSMESTKDYSFLSYANLPSSGASIDASSSDEILLTISDISLAQNDVMLGQKTLSKPENGNVEMNYSHPLSSVKFQLGNAVDVPSVSKISIAGVYSSGKTSLDQTPTQDSNNITEYTWSNLGSADAIIDATGLSAAEGDTIATFVVIPQDLSAHNVVVTITYDTDKTMIKTLTSGNWAAGYTTFYTLDKVNSVDIIFNPTSKTVTNNGESKAYVRAAITGAWYDSGGNLVAPWSTSEGTFSGLPGTGWTLSGGFYYYGEELENGDATSSLFSSFSKPTAPVTGATLKLDVLVQSIPYNVNKSCQEAFAAL